MTPNATKLDALLDALIETARPILIRQCGPDSCIASTRTAIEVLRRFGVRAQPWAVTFTAANRLWVDFRQSGRQDYAAWEAEGAWAVGTGAGIGRPHGWVGHLVAIVEDSHLLDLSLDQASRPEHNLLVGPFHKPIPASFLRAGGKIAFQDARSGVVVEYTSNPSNRRWKQTPAWHDRRCGDVVREVLRALPSNIRTLARRRSLPSGVETPNTAAEAIP